MVSLLPNVDFGPNDHWEGPEGIKYWISPTFRYSFGLQLIIKKYSFYVQLVWIDLNRYSNWRLGTSRWLVDKPSTKSLESQLDTFFNIFLKIASLVFGSIDFYWEWTWIWVFCHYSDFHLTDHIWPYWPFPSICSIVKDLSKISHLNVC